MFRVECFFFVRRKYSFFTSEQESDPVTSNQEAVQRGPKQKLFTCLSESEKHKRSKKLGDSEPLEKLLRAAENVCKHNSSPGMVKVLRHLRMTGEAFAKKALKRSSKRNLSKATAERSLYVKTRLGLTCRAYTGIRKHAKTISDEEVLVPWKDAMKYRDEIIPSFDTPTWKDGVLCCSVTLREMVTNIIGRLLDLDDVKEAFVNQTSSVLNCSLLMSAGVDSATGFSHYNQKNLLRKDDSLLTECVLPLILEAQSGQKLWVNPCPQSDQFCRPKSMRWQKETDAVTRQIFDSFFEEVDEIAEQPVVVKTEV